MPNGGAATSASISTLPNLGDGAEMSPAAERRLGDRIARVLYRDPDYIDDPVIMEYVDGIWQPLLAAARLRGELPAELDGAYAWEILLGRDRTVNAFALPGAYLGLHLGLVAVVTSKDELASVLAHELSHVTQRHISRLISRQGQQTPWLMGAMILGILAASRDPNAAQTMIVGGQAVAAQSQLNFSRDMEREADRVGFGVMTQAGFEPLGFVTMFEKLQQASRLNDTGGFPYLRSHPLTTERMADMQARLPANAAKSPSTSAQSLEHVMVSARARVLSNPGVDALRTWAVEVSSAGFAKSNSTQQAGVLYGASLAALKLRDMPTAQALLKRLTDLTQADRAASRVTRLLAAELALAQGDAAKANNVLSGMDVSGRAAMLLSSRAAVQAGQAARVTESLQTWLVDHPRDAQAWLVLASANAAQGRSLAAIRAEAEADIAHQDYASAASRLKAAQDMVRSGAKGVDHIEASIVDTRARQVALLLREQALER